MININYHFKLFYFTNYKYNFKPRGNALNLIVIDYAAGYYKNRLQRIKYLQKIFCHSLEVVIDDVLGVGDGDGVLEIIHGVSGDAGP